MRSLVRKAGHSTLFLLLIAPPALAQMETAAPLAEAAAAADPLPVPESLRGRIDFWKSVYATWNLSQVVLHDIDHPELVYDVLVLPGPAGETYTEEQRLFVRSRREALEARLLALEKKVAGQVPLLDDEKALALQVTTSAGVGAIRGAHERVRSQRGLRERFRRGIEVSGRYDAIFRDIFKQAGLPEDLAYLPHVESSFQAEARSSAGAVGIWQFTRPAARIFMNVNSAIDERLDPVAAARGAARYLGRAYGILDDWALGVTSYNHGIEGMTKAKERFGTDFERILGEFDGKYFGFASKSFYAEFLAAREIAKDPARFFPEGFTAEAPLAYDRVSIDRPMSPVSLARTYGVELSTLASINPAWTRRAVRGGLALPAGTEVWLPQGASKRTAKPTTVAALEPAPKSAPDHRVHVVERGENLFRIATTYRVELAALLGLNRLTAQSVIHPGQRLRIPIPH